MINPPGGLYQLSYSGKLNANIQNYLFFVKDFFNQTVKPQLRVGIEITHYFQEIDLERHLFLDFPRIYPGSF